MSHFPLDLMHVLASYSTEELWDLFQSVTGAQQSDQSCSICMLPVGTSSPGVFGFLANCVHVFCGHCILEWSRARVEPAQHTCPVCRTAFGTVLFWPRLVSTYEREQLFRYQVEMLGHVNGRDREVEQAEAHRARRDQQEDRQQDRQQDREQDHQQDRQQDPQEGMLQRIGEVVRDGIHRIVEEEEEVDDVEEQLRQGIEEFNEAIAAEQVRWQARLEADRAQRIREQIQREAARAQRDADRARRVARRAHEQAQRDAEQVRRDAEQARRDAGRAREQAQRDAEQALRQANEARANARRAAESPRHRHHRH